MRIIFDNKQELEIILRDTPVTPVIKKIYKHLGHVPLPFRPWDNPAYVSSLGLEDVIKQLVLFGEKLGVSVDTIKCQQRDQTYFNQIHEIYERNYDGNPAWLDYHDHIHLCERVSHSNKQPNSVLLYHRELAGPLIKPFDMSWLNYSTTEIKPGDVFVSWAELGKTPYQYWKDKELDNLERLCKLSKPWINFFPNIIATIEPQSLLANKPDRLDFENWWVERNKFWCQHWNLDSWDFVDMYSALVIGNLDVDRLQQLLVHAQPLYVRMH
jgi:hypothetical protein